MTKRQTLRMAGLGILIATSCGTTGDALTNSGVAGDPDTDGTRLKVMYHRWNASDGTRMTIPVNRFYDTKLKVECTFVIAEDGVSRCLPVAIDHKPEMQTFNKDYYLDAACTKPVYRERRCTPQPEYASQAVEPKPCVSGTRMHKITGEVMPTVLFNNATRPCAKLQPTELANMLITTALYTTTPVAAAEFVSGDLQTVILP